MTFRIYMDVCCLNRPFDDQNQQRIHLESEAILLILERCQSESWELIGSEAINKEIAQIPNPERLQKVRQALSSAKSRIPASDTIQQRARQLETSGFKSYDALHLASAEAAEADVFLTTDDRLLERAIREAERLQVKSANPVFWLMAANAREGVEDDPH